MNSEKTMASFVVPVRLLDQVRQLASENDRSVSAELRRAIVEHVEREAISDPDERGEES